MLNNGIHSWISVGNYRWNAWALLHCGTLVAVLLRELQSAELCVDLHHFRVAAKATRSIYPLLQRARQVRSP